MEKSKEVTRTYTIPLRSAFRNAARYKKTNRAVRAVRAFLQRHLKSDDIRLGQHLNTFLWARGISHPPPRVTVTAVKDEEGVVRAELEGKEFRESVKPMPKEEEPEGLKEKLESTLKKKPKEEESAPKSAQKPATSPQKATQESQKSKSAPKKATK